MRITAYKRETGLSQDYVLKTTATPCSGVYVTVYDPADETRAIGQWLNPRQDVDDTRPMECVIIVPGEERRMRELLDYFNQH